MAHNVEVFAKECFRVSNSILHKQKKLKITYREKVPYEPPKSC